MVLLVGPTIGCDENIIARMIWKVPGLDKEKYGFSSDIDFIF